LIFNRNRSFIFDQRKTKFITVYVKNDKKCKLHVIMNKNVTPFDDEQLRDRRKK